MLHSGDNVVLGVPVSVERKRIRCINLRSGKLSFTFQGFRYEVGCAADVSPTDNGFTFQPRAGAIRLDLSLPEVGP